MATEKDVQKAPAPAGVALVTTSNCKGKLVRLADPGEGVTHNNYRCTVCGQVVHVGHEELEANGLPPEHAKPD